MRRLLGMLLPVLAQAQEGWGVELMGGSAWSLSTPLVIRQEGREELRVRARYSTRPFAGSPYYAWRVGRWRGGRGWELELVHHKLYLENPPPEVQHFEVTHGYNLVFVNRAWARGGWILRAGAGPVVAHAESVVRGEWGPSNRGLFGSGYEVAGPAAQVALARPFPMGARAFLMVEVKVTGAWARSRVARGWAEIPNLALHGLAGVGWRF